MRIVFRVRPDGQRARANEMCIAEVYFPAESIFHGMRLVGFTVWSGDYGPFVTFPAKELALAGDTKKKRYWDFLRSQEEGGPLATEGVSRTKAAILQEWQAQGSPGLR